MKKAAFILLLVPALLFVTSFAETLDQTAYARPAASGGHGGSFGRATGGGGYYGGGSHGGGHSYYGGGSRSGYYGGRGGYYGKSYYGHGGHYGHSSSSFSVWLGPGWYDPFFYPYYYPYYPYYPYPYYSAPTVVVPQQPQEYIMQTPQEERSYWYYCKESKGYYPYVKRCPGGWMKVVPAPAPPESEPAQEDQQ